MNNTKKGKQMIFDQNTGFFVKSFNELSKAGKRDYFRNKYNSYGWYKYKMFESICVK